MTDYDAFAARISASGLVTDPWLAGEPRFREEPVVLDAKAARAMSRAGEAVAEVYNEVCLLVADEPDLLDSFFGLTGWQKAMWLSSQPLWHGVARADVFVTKEGLQIAELNSDTPTGEAEAIVLGGLLRETRPELVDPNERLGERIAEASIAMAEAVLGRALEPRACGVIYPTELPEDLGLVRLYRSLFEARGFEVVLGSPYNVAFEEGDASLRVFDRPVSLLLRHYKTDWWGERQSVWTDEELPDPAALDEALEAILAAELAGKVAVVNPFGAVLPQNKRAMAFMWEHIHRFSSRAQDTIRAFVPVTKRLEAVHVEQLRAQKADWVLKSDYGAEGDEVVIGRVATDDAWNATLSLARPGRWIAQRFFEAEANDRGEVVNHGVFVVAGEAAGIYGRVQAGATDERAFSVPVGVRG